MKFLRGLLVGALVVSGSPAWADVLGELSAADQAKVKAGEQVMLSEPLDGYPWPRVRVYQKSDSTPREVMAVFFDYDNACHYVPNCLKSQIAKTITARSFDVDYVIDVPILADEAYTVRNVLTAGLNGQLTVTWKVLRATSIEESAGSLVVEPLGSGSVLRYTNLVKPSSRAAFLLKGMAMSQMRDTVTALVDQVKKTAANPSAMATPMKRLDAALP